MPIKRKIIKVGDSFKSISKSVRDSENKKLVMKKKKQIFKIGFI